MRVFTEADPRRALQACRAFAVSMDEDDEDDDEDGGGGAHANGKQQQPPPPSKRPRRLALVDRIERGKPLLLFVAGDRSKVGKSR